MKWRYHTILIALVGLVGLYFILSFAVSDFIPAKPFRVNIQSIEEPPSMRPFFRLLFGAVMTPLFLGFLAWYAKAVSREQR